MSGPDESSNEMGWTERRRAYLEALVSEPPDREEALQHFGHLVLLALEELQIPADPDTANMPFLTPMRNGPGSGATDGDLRGGSYIALVACHPNRPLRSIVLTRGAVEDTVYFTATVIRHELAHSQDFLEVKRKLDEIRHAAGLETPTPGRRCVTRRDDATVSGPCCRPDRPAMTGDCEGDWCSYIRKLRAYTGKRIPARRHTEISLDSVVSFDSWTENERRAFFTDLFAQIRIEAEGVQQKGGTIRGRVLVSRNAPQTVSTLLTTPDDDERASLADLIVREIVGHVDRLPDSEKDGWKSVYRTLFSEWLRSSSASELERLAKRLIISSVQR